MMRKTKQFILTCLMLILVLTSNAQTKETYDWTKVMNAIIQVESQGNAKAHNPVGDCAGILQITPILVKECNRILAEKKSTKRYVYDEKGKCRSSKWDDRYSVEKSKEMFILIQEYHNPKHDIEKAIKCWNCGGFFLKNNGWKNKSIGYYNKVMKYYNGGN